MSVFYGLDKQIFFFFLAHRVYAFQGKHIINVYLQLSQRIKQQKYALLFNIFSFV